MADDAEGTVPECGSVGRLPEWTSCSRAITLGSRPALTVFAVIACRGLLAKNQRMMCLTQDPCVRNVEWRCRVQGLGVRCHLLSARHIPGDLVADALCRQRRAPAVLLGHPASGDPCVGVAGRCDQAERRSHPTRSGVIGSRIARCGRDFRSW